MTETREVPPFLLYFHSCLWSHQVSGPRNVPNWLCVKGFLVFLRFITKGNLALNQNGSKKNQILTTHCSVPGNTQGISKLSLLIFEFVRQGA